MKRIFRRINLVILFLIGTWTGMNAQEDLKYKDIFAAIQNLKKEEVYPLLKTYQAKDPHFANAYYQLGLISEEWAKSYDPLTEFEQVDYFIYDTKLYFGLARHYLDDKQVRRYREFFNKIKPAPGKTEPGLKEIQDDITEHLVNIENFEKHVRLSHSSFTSCVAHYNNCLKLFMNINGKQNMLKEIYLTANDSLMQLTRFLVQDFDSALYYFDIYRSSIDSFPLKNYHQRRFLRSIETYRLDGLTGSDFRKDTVQIWNYKAWVNELEAIINTEIKELRSGVDSVNYKLDKAITAFRDNPDLKGNKTNQVIVEPLIRNKLIKMDFGSTALQLINYKESLLQYLVLSHDSLNAPADTAKTFSLHRKSSYYKDLSGKKLELDSLLTLFGNSAIPANTRKYEKFFLVHFPANESINNYLGEQKQFFTKILDKSFENFTSCLIEKPATSASIPVLSWKKIPLSTSIVIPGQPDLLTGDHYLTYSVKPDNTGNLFISGSFIQTSKKPLAFIAYVEKGKPLSWLKTFDLGEAGQEYYNYALHLELNNNGCIAVVTSLLPGIDSVTVSNSLLRLDQKGNEISRQKINAGQVLRWFLFDDINNRMFAAFQGKKIGQIDPGASEITFSALDSAGLTLWNSKTKLDGQLSDIIRMGSNWLIFCNATSYQKGTDWITLKDDQGQASRKIVSFLLDENGNNLLVNEYKPSFFHKAIKLSSETINILAFRNTPQTNPGSSSDNPGKLVYILTDKKGKSLYTYY